MIDQDDQFVFVVNQAQPFNRPSISTINSQVAKYAHSRRRRSADTGNHIRRRPPYLTREVKSDELQNLAKGSLASDPRSWSISASYHDSEVKNTPCCRWAELGMVKDHKSLLKYKPNAGTPSKWDTKVRDSGSDVSGSARIPRALSPLVYPESLNAEEQFLMHHWFSRVFPDDFSTTLQFDGFMGPLSRYPISYSVPLRWAIAKAAERLLGDKDTDTRIVCQSRSKAIEEWRGVMSNPYMSTDEVLASAVYTIVKNDGNEKIHLQGLDIIIASRGGLESVLKETKIVQPEHIIHMYTFAPFTIDTYNQLASLKAAFFSALTYIGDGIRSSLSEPTTDIRTAGDHLGNHYDILSESTVIGRHIRLEFDTDSEYSLKARYFCAMLMLNLSLLSLASTADRIDYLKKLEKATNAAAFPDLVTGRFRMRAGAFVFIIGHVYGGMLDTVKNMNASAAVTGIATAAVASMKIFGLLSDALQLRLFSRLQHGLIYLSHNAESFTHTKGCFSKDLGEIPISAISEEIDRLWLKRKMASTAS